MPIARPPRPEGTTPPVTGAFYDPETLAPNPLITPPVPEPEPPVDPEPPSEEP
jgi:hypothetical protein